MAVSYQLPIVEAGRPFVSGLARPIRQVAPFRPFPDWPHCNPGRPERRGAAIVLPEAGFYFLRDDTRLRAYIASSRDPQVNARVAFSFAAGASTGEDLDNQSFYADPDGFCAGLFERDARARVNCGPTARVLRTILRHLDIRSRLLQWVGDALPFAFHQSLEVDLPGAGWTLVDPHFGLAYVPGTRALDVFLAARDGEPLIGAVEDYLPKHDAWLGTARDVYRRFPVAFGIVEAGGSTGGERLSVLAGDSARLATHSTALRSLYGEISELSHAEIVRAFYREPCTPRRASAPLYGSREQPTVSNATRHAPYERACR